MCVYTPPTWEVVVLAVQEVATCITIIDTIVTIIYTNDTYISTWEVVVLAVQGEVEGGEAGTHTVGRHRGLAALGALHLTPLSVVLAGGGSEALAP
jgi:hypothetical protein